MQQPVTIEVSPLFIGVCLVILLAVLFGRSIVKNRREERAKFEAQRAQDEADMAALKAQKEAERLAEQERERQKQQAEAQARREAQQKAERAAAQRVEAARRADERQRNLAYRDQLERDLHTRFYAFLFRRYVDPPDPVPSATMADFLREYTLNTPEKAGLLRTSDNGLTMRMMASAPFFPSRIEP